METDGNDTLVMRGTGGNAGGIKGQLKYQARVKVIAKGGKTTAEAGRISVTNANEVTLLIAAATSYKKFDDVSGDPESIVKQQLAAAAKKSFAELRAAHLADYQALFRRVTIDLGQSDAMKLPTDVRIRRFAEGNDPQLAALYYQFGRYLLISCSRPGGQPATLQGLWNESMNPPWQSKYTININTEMNYWPAESGNLAECVEPLIAMVNDLTVTGARTAQKMYGARGWVVHHNTDLWRASAPIDGPNWGMWPMRRRLAVPASLGSLRVQRRQGGLETHLPGAQGRVGILPRHVAGRAETQMARHQSLDLAGERPSVWRGGLRRADDGHANPARPVRQHDQGGGDARRG